MVSSFFFSKKIQEKLRRISMTEKRFAFIDGQQSTVDIRHDSLRIGLAIARRLDGRESQMRDARARRADTKRNIKKHFNINKRENNGNLT